MAGGPVRIRPATAADAGAVAGLADGLAQSFTFSRASFDAHYPALLATGHACVLVADAGAAGTSDRRPRQRVAARGELSAARVVLVL